MAAISDDRGGETLRAILGAIGEEGRSLVTVNRQTTQKTRAARAADLIDEEVVLDVYPKGLGEVEADASRRFRDPR